MPKHPSDYGSAPVWPALPTCQGKPRHSRDLAVLRGHALAEAAAPATRHPKWQSTSLIRMKKCNLKESFNLLFQKRFKKNVSTNLFFHIIYKKGSIIMQLFGTCLKYITPPNVCFILPASADVPRRARPPRPTAKSMRPQVGDSHGPWWKNHQIPNVPN